MTVVQELDGALTLTTDGEIAIRNLESARRRSWTRFFEHPTHNGAAEAVVEHEQLTLQFVGDVTALDRVEFLAAEFSQVDATSARIALTQAQVASMAHRFSDARQYLALAENDGAPKADIDRLRLSIDQACGVNLDVVLDARSRLASETYGLEDFIALGSLLADLRDFVAADGAFKQALRAYRDVSPLPIARACFQLGMLWGELAPEPNPTLAAQWYRQALAVLPMYTKARVHLAEICFAERKYGEAEGLLRPAETIGDPEVDWWLADVLAAQGKSEDSELRMKAALSGYETLLERHLLAFADHGAEFYAGSGNNCRKALQLARVNAANRPTLRALEQAHDIAISADDMAAAFQFLSEAVRRWGHTSAFALSSLQRHRLKN